MSGFTPVWRSILASTVWLEPPHVKVVWWTMLLLCDRRGIVEGSVPGLAKEAVVSVDECRDALERLMQPDKDSRSKEFDGRRILPVDGGWMLVNHQKYKDKLRLSDEGNRQRVARFRAKRKAEGKGSNVTVRDCNDLDPRSEIKTQEEIPPTPQSAEPDPEPRPQRTPRRDPLAEQLEGKLPGQRRDVQTLFAEWRKVFGSPNAKLVHANGTTAHDLATAIDAHGLELCIKVCREAVNDGMVSGRDDERHVKHTSASYIFGNENTFNRILKSVEEKSTRESAADMIERMKKAPAAQC